MKILVKMLWMQVFRTQVWRQHNASVMAVLAKRVDMHHAMLYEREVSFNCSMHRFCDMVRLQQSQVVLDAKLNIHIDAVAEKTRMQAVEMLYAGNADNELL